ncbi:hypothetical protein BGZ95_003156 [Linnemannia exigua]|uniref:Uncharacterized protein n=1 Tax=Linnemannia exigua TaxID=604196 RepID=A0AAD4D6D3_9FUNG|nr:hypothetical protein BGZ95_003156 [Linnemannia exigua]
MPTSSGRATTTTVATTTQSSTTLVPSNTTLDTTTATTATITTTATTTTMTPLTEPPSAMVSPSITPVTDSKTDTSLLGSPSVVGGFNLTMGIIVCGSIVSLFIIIVGAATIHRARSRRAFRRQLAAAGEDGGEDGRFPPPGSVDISTSEKVEVPDRAMIGRDGGYGRGGDDDAGARRTDYTSAPPARNRDNRYPSPHAALYKQASISRRGLIADAAPNGISDAVVPTRKPTTTTSSINNINNSIAGRDQYNNRTSRSRAGSRAGTAPSSVAPSPAPSAAAVPAMRFDEKDSSSQQASRRSTGTKRARHPPAPTVTINYKTPSVVNTDYDMTAYSPEPVGHDDEIDDDVSASDYSSPHPMQRDSLTQVDDNASLDAYHSGAFLNAIHEYTLYSAPLSLPLSVVPEPEPAMPKVQPLQPVYHSRGQQGYQSQSQTLTNIQQKRQSPPPPPKSLKRLSPVSTANLSKNYQQAQPVASTAAANRGIQRTGFTPRIATQGLDRSGSGQSSPSSSSPRGTPRSNTDSPTERLNNKFAQTYYNTHYGRSGTNTHAASSPIPGVDKKHLPASLVSEMEMNSYPTPIARSNSTRLPAHLRGGGSVIGMHVGTGGGQQVGSTFVNSYGNNGSSYF